MLTYVWKLVSDILDFVGLEARGWAIVEGVTSAGDLLQIGRSLGQPVLSPNGELIREIRVTPSSQAHTGTQSAHYGTGSFPLHTDTVFWPLPARYVILRATGDVRRPTTVLSFAKLLEACSPNVLALVERSVWLIGNASGKLRKFYCSLRFKTNHLSGLRYDADSMTAANSAAERLDAVFRPVVASGRADRIHWSGSNALILSNWRVLHGRGPEPIDEGLRIIQRLYVA